MSKQTTSASKQTTNAFIPELLILRFLQPPLKISGIDLYQHTNEISLLPQKIMISNSLLLEIDLHIPGIANGMLSYTRLVVERILTSIYCSTDYIRVY